MPQFLIANLIYLRRKKKKKRRAKRKPKTTVIWPRDAKKWKSKHKSCNWTATDGKRPRERPRKRWIDRVGKNLETLEATSWEDRIQNREDWRTVTVPEKILKEQWNRKEEEEDYYLTTYKMILILRILICDYCYCEF